MRARLAADVVVAKDHFVPNRTDHWGTAARSTSPFQGSGRACVPRSPGLRPGLTRIERPFSAHCLMARGVQSLRAKVDENPRVLEIRREMMAAFSSDNPAVGQSRDIPEVGGDLSNPGRVATPNLFSYITPRNFMFTMSVSF